jgi:hypothetical protein
MKKEIRDFNLERGTVQVTVADERWYSRLGTNAVTGLPEIQYVPSVTWIAGHYPKGVGFYKWLADKGWDESEAIKSAAGDKGSRVHRAIVDLIDGQTVPMDAKYAAGDEPAQELSLEEYDCLRSFADWWVACEPETLAREVTVFNEEYHYAGTLDWVGMLHKPPKGLSPGPWLLDWKTSKDVWPEHEIQVSGYAHSDYMTGFAHCSRGDALEKREYRTFEGEIMWHLGILQVGYRRNKAGWKLTEVQDQFPLFLAARQIWEKETEGQDVFRRDYPLSLCLPMRTTP